MIIKLRDTRGVNRTIGRTESGVYYSDRNPKNIYFMRDGFAISTLVLSYLMDTGVSGVSIKCDGVEYQVPTVNFYLSGTKIQDGCDTQFCLSKVDFNGY